MPDARTGIHAPADKENFPLLKTDDNQAVHQSVCLSPSSSTYHEITPTKHAFFNLLDCALYMKKQEELSPCETFYWLLFIEISRLSQAKDRPSVTFCDKDFYTEDFIEHNKFRSKYLQIVSPKNPKLSELFDEFMNEVHADAITEPSSNQTELSELFDPSSNKVHADTPQTAGLQNFFTDKKNNPVKLLEENNYSPETAHLPKPALEKLNIFRKERSEYRSKHLST